MEVALSQTKYQFVTPRSYMLLLHQDIFHIRHQCRMQDLGLCRYLVFSLDSTQSTFQYHKCQFIGMKAQERCISQLRSVWCVGQELSSGIGLYHQCLECHCQSWQYLGYLCGVHETTLVSIFISYNPSLATRDVRLGLCLPCYLAVLFR